MKIKITVGNNYDGCEWQEMSIDDKHVASVYPLYECPEDAIIGRDLISCKEIVSYMKQAYEAGKRGEEFEVEEVKDADEE